MTNVPIVQIRQPSTSLVETIIQDRTIRDTSFYHDQIKQNKLPIIL